MSTKAQTNLEAQMKQLNLELTRLNKRKHVLRARLDKIKQQQVYLYAGIKPGDVLECIATLDRRRVKVGDRFVVHGLGRMTDSDNEVYVCLLTMPSGKDKYVCAAPSKLRQWFKKVQA